MKKIVVLFMLAIPISGFCQLQKFTVRGRIAGVSPKVKAYLVYQLGAKMIIDSSRLDQGKFEFSGTLEEPMEASLILGHTGVLPEGTQLDYQSVYLENGIVHVEGKDSLFRSKIWGTPLNADNQQKTKLVNAIDRKILFGMREKEERKVMAAFVNTHPASRVSMDWMRSIGGRDSTVIVNYPKLAAALKQTKTGKELGMAVKTSMSIRIGQVAPDFILPDQEGHPIKLSDFRGKYVLLDFWASWCHPCRELQPKLTDLYNELKATGKFVILAVSLDKDQSAWLKAIKEDKVPWLQVADLNIPVNKAAQLYDVTLIPASFLIDPDGKIAGLGPNRELLKEKLLGPGKSETAAVSTTGPLSDLNMDAILTLLSKDKVSKADILEDYNTLNATLNTDIGEGALVKELDGLDMVKDSAAFYGLLSTKAVELNRKKMKMKQQFVREHPASFLSLYELIDNECMYSSDSYAFAYQQLSDQLKNTKAAEIIRGRIEQLKITPTGMQAKNFTRKNQYGQSMKLSDYKGKVVLLDFWGSWCKVCRETHPHLKELYKTYKSKGFEIIAVANEHSKVLSENKAAWLAAIKKDDVNWLHVLNDEGTGDLDIVKAYGITGYPTKILLDRDGKILMRVYSGLNDEMDQLIKSTLEK